MGDAFFNRQTITPESAVSQDVLDIFLRQGTIMQALQWQSLSMPGKLHVFGGCAYYRSNQCHMEIASFPLLEGELVTSTRYDPAGAGWTKGVTIKFNSLTAALEHFYKHPDLVDVPMLHYLSEEAHSPCYRLRGGTGKCAYLDLGEDHALTDKVCDLVSKYHVGFSAHPFSVSEDDGAHIFNMTSEHALEAIEHWLKSHCNLIPSTSDEVKSAKLTVAPPDYLVVECGKDGYRGNQNYSLGDNDILCVFGDRADFDDGTLRVSVEFDQSLGKYEVRAEEVGKPLREKAFYDLASAVHYTSQDLLKGRPHTIVDFQSQGCSQEDFNKKYVALLPDGKRYAVIAAAAEEVYSTLAVLWPKHIKKPSFDEMIAKGDLSPAPGKLNPGVEIHNRHGFSFAIHEAGYNISSIRHGGRPIPLSDNCWLDAVKLDPWQIEMVLDQMEALGGKYLFDRASFKETLTSAITAARTAHPGDGKKAFIVLAPHARDGMHIRHANTNSEGGNTHYDYELFMELAKAKTQQMETVSVA